MFIKIEHGYVLEKKQSHALFIELCYPSELLEQVKGNVLGFLKPLIVDRFQGPD